MKITMKCRCGVEGSWEDENKGVVLKMARSFQDEHAKCPVANQVILTTTPMPVPFAPASLDPTYQPYIGPTCRMGG